MLHCLKAISIPDQLYAWAKECIATPKYSIALNGVWLGASGEKRGWGRGSFIPIVVCHSHRGNFKDAN